MRVHQHVQAAAVGHADHDLLHALGAGFLDQFVHRGDEALAAFERKALLADVLGVQEALQAFGRRHLLEDVLLLLHREVRLAADRLQLLLPPALLVLVGDVHVLGADGAAVGLAQRVDQLAQRHAVAAEEGVAGVEHRFLVGVAEAVEGRIEFGDLLAFGALERVEVGPAGTDVAIGRDQLLHRGALAPHLRIGPAGAHHPHAALLGALGEGVDHRQVRDILGAAAVGGGHVLERVEVVAPVVGNAAGIGEVVFVHLLDIGRIAAEEIGIALVGRVDGAGLTHSR